MLLSQAHSLLYGCKTLLAKLNKCKCIGILGRLAYFTKMGVSCYRPLPFHPASQPVLVPFRPSGGVEASSLGGRLCRLLQPLLCQSLFLGMCHVVSCRSLQDMWMVVADRRIFHLGRQKKADDDSLELGTALGSNQGGGRCPEGFGARLWGQASAFVQEWRSQPQRRLI